MRYVLLIGWMMVSSCALGQDRGDWVLARWRGGDYWFPGVVEGRDGKLVRVAYDDGTRESTPLSRVKAYDWRVGSAIQCRWNGGSEWYAATIAKVSKDGLRLTVIYDDDGVRETLQTGVCRSQ